VPGSPRNWDSDTVLTSTMPNFSLPHKRVKVLARMRIGRLATGEKPAIRGLRQRRPDPAQGLPDFAMKFQSGLAGEGAKMLPLRPGGCGAYRSFR
jgi:hypothetical protein